MMDVHSTDVRRRNMAAIRGKNTKPELMIRSALHAAGLRFRLHSRVLPGHPDIVLRKHRAVILVHGCFFHGHNCSAFRWPTTRAEFWRKKIIGNRVRDERNLALLLREGWRVLIVRECVLRGANAKSATAISDTLDWVRGSETQGEIGQVSCKDKPWHLPPKRK